MKKHFLSLLLAIMILGLAVAAQARTFIVYNFDAGRNGDDGRVMAELLRAEMERIPDTQVKEAPAKACHQVDCAAKVRQERGVSAVVVGEAMSLGGRDMLMVKAVWKDDTLRYKVPLANTGEFENMAERLAVAIVKKRGFEEELGMDSVGEREQDPNKKKVHGDFSIGGSLGAWKPLADSYLGADFLYMFTGFLRYELSDIAVDLESGMYYSNSIGNDIFINEIPIDVTLSYYFSKHDRSPFIGGTFGIHVITLADESDSPDAYEDRTYWAPHFGGFVGYEFGRAQVLSLAVRLGYKADLVTFKRVEGAAKEDSGEGAHGPFFGLVVTFF